MPGPITNRRSPSRLTARYSGQPVYGYYQSDPNGYYPGPYRYSTGYGGYYAPVYQGGYYYGSARLLRPTGDLGRSEASAVESASGGDCRARAIAFLVAGSIIIY